MKTFKSKERDKIAKSHNSGSNSIELEKTGRRFGILPYSCSSVPDRNESVLSFVLPESEQDFGSIALAFAILHENLKSFEVMEGEKSLFRFSPEE